MSVRPGQTQRQGERKGGKYLVSGAGEKLRKREENVWRKKQTRLVKKKKNTVGKRSKIFGGGKSDDRQTNRISSCRLDPFCGSGRVKKLTNAVDCYNKKYIPRKLK